MREIKFRVWSEKNNKMHDVDSLFFNNPKPGIWLNQSDIFGYAGDFLILMQFTGLLDKNGKRIYEGDIVKTPDGLRTINWNQLHCAWGLFLNNMQTDKMLADWIKPDSSTPKQWESTNLMVVGNIYEHEIVNGELEKRGKK